MGLLRRSAPAPLPVETTPEPEPVPPFDVRAVEQFLFREARLLDERRWDDWLALWADDATYAMPMRSIPQPDDHTPDRPVSAELSEPDQLWWFDEGKEILELRVAKFKTGKAWAEDPPSRTRRFVTNIEFGEPAPGADLTVRSNLLLYRGRLEHDMEILAAQRKDTLRPHDGGYRLASRLVTLDVNVPPVANLCLFF